MDCAARPADDADTHLGRIDADNPSCCGSVVVLWVWSVDVRSSPAVRTRVPFELRSLLSKTLFFCPDRTLVLAVFNKEPGILPSLVSTVCSRLVVFCPSVPDLPGELSLPDLPGELFVFKGVFRELAWLWQSFVWSRLLPALTNRL